MYKIVRLCNQSIILKAAIAIAPNANGLKTGIVTTKPVLAALELPEPTTLPSPSTSMPEAVPPDDSLRYGKEVFVFVSRYILGPRLVHCPIGCN
jgi:hypothetical protein